MPSCAPRTNSQGVTAPMARTRRRRKVRNEKTLWTTADSPVAAEETDADRLPSLPSRPDPDEHPRRCTDLLPPPPPCSRTRMKDASVNLHRPRRREEPP